MEGKNQSVTTRMTVLPREVQLGHLWLDETWDVVEWVVGEDYMLESVKIFCSMHTWSMMRQRSSHHSAYRPPGFFFEEFMSSVGINVSLIASSSLFPTSHPTQQW